MEKKYQIYADNIGKVEETASISEAVETFNYYIDYVSPEEEVCLLFNDELLAEGIDGVVVVYDNTVFIDKFTKKLRVAS